MRPVNLIPKEQRPGSQRPMRGGPLAYVVVGALALLLIGIVVLVVTGNQISEREAEVVSVQKETQAAEAKAQRLAAYTEFHGIREQRLATVTSLADSRFDWQRVMRELALVLPGNVWLTNLGGTVTPNVSVDGAPSVALRSTIPGPALELVGCARDQNAVAGFVQALKQIDGVTRVGVQSSNLGFSSGGGKAARRRPRPARRAGSSPSSRSRSPSTRRRSRRPLPAKAPNRRRHRHPKPPAEEGESTTASSEEGGG